MNYDRHKILSNDVLFVINNPWFKKLSPKRMKQRSNRMLRASGFKSIKHLVSLVSNK